MFIVGIDIAKRSHEAVVVDPLGSVLVKPFKFSNDAMGFNKLLETLSSLSPDLSSFVFGMEATGHYWLNLYCKLVDLGLSLTSSIPFSPTLSEVFLSARSRTIPRIPSSSPKLSVSAATPKLHFPTLTLFLLES